MARAFSEEEKEIIKKELLKVGEEVFSKYGLKKTNISDITTAVGIGKGSFYSFYESKELLFLDVLIHTHLELNNEIEDYLNNKLTTQKGALYELFKFIIELSCSKPLLSKSMSEEEDFFILKRKIPQEIIDKIVEEGQVHFDNLIERLKKKGLVKKDINTKIALGIIKSINFSYLHKDIIGKDIIDDVIDIKLKLFSNWLEADLED